MSSSHTDQRAGGAGGRLRPARYPLIVQFLKFALVGVSNTLLTLLVYTFLLKVVGMWYLAASAIGFTAGAVNGFLLNRRWTFREHVGDALTPVRWAIVQGCGLAVNEGMLYVLVHDAHVEKVLAQVAATVIVTITTFLANRAWTFRVHAPVAVAGSSPGAPDA
ncbi:MAG TPA: GtrA family protein [Solirubrobacteraceae bacterium]|nr:GtrA family protein [Solirubrobacteraceae bacterium]